MATSPEWENIPHIIPLSISALSRDIASLQGWVNARESEESVPSLSRKLTALQQQISQLSQKVQEPKPKETDDTLPQQLKDLEARIALLSVRPETREVQIITEMTAEHFVAQPEVTHITEESHEAVNEAGHEAVHEELEEEEVKPVTEQEKIERDRPRLLSLNTFKRLVFNHLAKSRLKSKVDRHESQFPIIESTLSRLDAKLQEIVSEFQREIERVYAKFEQEEDRLTKICADISSKFKEIAHWEQSAESNIAQLKKDTEKNAFSLQDLTDWYERTKTFLAKIDARIEAASHEVETNLQKDLSTVRSKLQEESARVDKSIQEVQKVILVNVDQRIASQREAIQELAQTKSADSGEGLAELRADLETQLADYRGMVESDFDRVARELREEKLSTADLLRTHSIELKKVRMELDKVVSSYIEPKQISDARLYATEARIREEETQRLEDLHFLKDIIKKLVFSIEQNILTTLMQPRAPGAEIDSNMTLFVKRLSFLKKIVQVPVKAVVEAREKPTPRIPSPMNRPLPRLNRSMIQEGSESSFVTQGSVLEHKYKDASSGHTRDQSKEA